MQKKKLKYLNVATHRDNNKSVWSLSTDFLTEGYIQFSASYDNERQFTPY